MHFASDNYATVHPEVLTALAVVNDGHQISYGGDPATEALHETVAHAFGAHARVFPMLTGTGANVAALMAMSPRWGAVVASPQAHIHTDENGAPERVGGLKILEVPAERGRISPQALDRWAGNLGDEHRAQPLVLSVTQSTELGTVYPLEDLAALTARAHELGMRVHVDGARLANAAATLGVTLAEACAGADVLSFGGTKNGAMLAEAVIVLAEDLADSLAHDLTYLRKTTMQLSSKMRYVSAQLTALLAMPEGGGEPLWLRNASHANAMAVRLRERLGAPSEAGLLSFSRPTEANAVFAVLPRAAADAVRTSWRFYDWGDGPSPELVEVRWMCAWDTAPDAVDAFAADLTEALRVL